MSTYNLEFAGISDEHIDYTNSNEALQREDAKDVDEFDAQLDTSNHSADERIYPMKSIKVERGFYSSYELKRKIERKIIKS